jgi:class 3 adenylate cyclase
VFKVDTVGDCYCCVTGVPIPKEDHAVVMADFAREILSAFNAVASTLEVQLGPDTADLSMRAGIHSGPGKRDNVSNVYYVHFAAPIPGTANMNFASFSDRWRAPRG